MAANPERVREFQEAYMEDFGEEITEAEAREMLSRVVAFLQLIARPLPPDPTQNS